MKKIRNFIYENRVMNVLKRHTPMIIKPACASVIMTIIWYYLMEPRAIYLKKSELPLTIAATILGVVYGVIAAFVITYNWEKYRRMSLYVVTMNKDQFLTQRDEKMPIMFHILLGGMALVIQFLVMLIPYENTFAGILFISISAFFLCLIGLITLELDNPIRSIWFQKSIPPDWMTENVKTYFEKKVSVDSSLAD
jgi:hypothetical protein